MLSLNIVCTSIGRETLPRLIESFKDQLDPTDIFTIISDINHEFVSEILSRYEFKFKVNHILNQGEQKWKYGHPLINENINSLEGDFIMFPSYLRHCVYPSPSTPDYPRITISMNFKVLEYSGEVFS
jgi:hypothetical protein